MIKCIDETVAVLDGALEPDESSTALSYHIAARLSPSSIKDIQVAYNSSKLKLESGRTLASTAV